MSVVLPVILLTGIFFLTIQRMIRSNVVSLTTGELALAFGAKVIFGCIYGYIFLRFYGGDDTWLLNQNASAEYERMVNQTRLFFDDLNPLLPFQRNEGFLAGFRGLLMDWEYYLLTRPLALFHFISGGNYYINVTFFSFMTFWGHYWLFNLLLLQFPDRRRILFILIFLFPPALFWLSGMRGDGALFFFLSLLLMNFQLWIELRKRRSLYLALLGYVGVLIFRDPIALALLPGLVAWYLAVQNRERAVRYFVGCYGVAMLVFFGSTLVSANRNLPAIIIQKQQAFMALHGNTRFQLDSLQPNLGSFVRVLPQAAANTFVRPLPWEAKGPLQYMAAADILFFWLLVLYTIRYRNERWRELLRDNVMLILLFLGVSLYLFIGYTVPFPGAIVRYKIIPEVFLYCYLAMLANLRSFKL